MTHNPQNILPMLSKPFLTTPKSVGVNISLVGFANLGVQHLCRDQLELAGSGPTEVHLETNQSQHQHH